MKTTTLYLLLILGCVLNGSSQQLDVNKFSLLDMRQGLTNNQVNDIIQDSFGFIWIATKKGLNRYDGNYFMQFYADSNKNSLPEDYITKLTMLPGNVLAASTTTGLFTINTKTLKSKTILIPADSLKYAYKVNVVMDVDADQNGNIYLLTRSGFYMMNAEGKILFRYDYYSAAEAVSKPFAFGYSLIKMNDDEYILSTAKGTLFYQAKKKTLTPITENKDPFLLKTIEPNIRFRTLFGNAESFIIMKDSVLILNYFNKIKRNYVEIKLSRAERENFDWRSKMFKLSDTLYAISGKENGFYFINYNKASQTFYFNSELQFEKYICKAVLKDREGRIWIGTNKGLFKEKIQSGIVEKISIPSTFKSDSTDLLFREVRLINDKIFVGGKGGLFVLDRKEGKTIKHFDFKRINPSSNIIWSLLALNRDTLFIGTYGPLIIFNPNTYSYKEGVLPGW
ncbi:MAG: two-component regulator propeller domain-containing protein, partial [Ferruginibacter sp.]